MDTPKIKKSQKLKGIERLPSDEKNNIIFKSYMHHFGNYKRIIIALHHLQEVEKMHNKDPSLSLSF